MCGISGIIGLLQNKSYIEYLKELLQFQDKRGPDSNGIYEYKNCLLGHNRLAIVDTEIRSLQPFIYEHLIIVFTISSKLEIFSIK